MNVHTHAKMQQHVGKGPRLGAGGEKEIADQKATTALPVMHISAIAQWLISNHEPDASACTTKSSPNDQFGWRVGSVRVKSTSSAWSRGGRVESVAAIWTKHAAVEISDVPGMRETHLSIQAALAWSRGSRPRTTGGTAKSTTRPAIHRPSNCRTRIRMPYNKVGFHHWGGVCDFARLAADVSLAS